MRYQYRILKHTDKAGYDIQCKPAGFWRFFFPWTLVAIETSLYKARLFCWNSGYYNIIPEVRVS